MEKNMYDLNDIGQLKDIPKREVLEFLLGESVYIHADIAIKIDRIETGKLNLADGHAYKLSHPQIQSDPCLLFYTSNISFYGDLCGCANRFWNKNPELWKN